MHRYTPLYFPHDEFPPRRQALFSIDSLKSSWLVLNLHDNPAGGVLGATRFVHGLLNKKGQARNLYYGRGQY